MSMASRPLAGFYDIELSARMLPYITSKVVNRRRDPDDIFRLEARPPAQDLRNSRSRLQSRL
jgi:hypothetical protein